MKTPILTIATLSLIIGIRGNNETGSPETTRVTSALSADVVPTPPPANGLLPTMPTMPVVRGTPSAPGGQSTAAQSPGSVRAPVPPTTATGVPDPSPVLPPPGVLPDAPAQSIQDPLPSPGTNFQTPTTIRDPFANTPALIQDAQGLGNGPTFYPGLATENTPVMRLRGQARLSTDTNAVALLELEGMGVFTVREGDTLSLQGRGRLSVVKVQKITKQSLFVEFGSMGQVMVVR